jgi:hypothetical protein
MKILLQTTIPTTSDDWSIGRFGQLAACLRRLRDNSDNRGFDVIMRDRDTIGRPDSVLSTLDRQPFDQLWLFAVDEGTGLTREDCQGISRFWSTAAASWSRVITWIWEVQFVVSAP